jgi:L-arabinose isomerase
MGPSVVASVRSGSDGRILAGGAHYTSFSQASTSEHMKDFAGMADVEFIRTATGTQIPALKNELRWNDAAYRLRG